MHQQVQPPAEYQFAARVLHDLADAVAVGGVVAVARTVFAAWLGVHGAVDALGKGVGQQFPAVWTEHQRLAMDSLDVVVFQVAGRTLTRIVVIGTVNADKLRQRGQIPVDF